MNSAKFEIETVPANAAERQAVSRRMKTYWARRKAAAKGSMVKRAVWSRGKSWRGSSGSVAEL